MSNNQNFEVEDPLATEAFDIDLEEDSSDPADTPPRKRPRTDTFVKDVERHKKAREEVIEMHL